ncbi:hypothetical protein JYU34_012366 [Plutella xylostella]|uniref:Secreted protein n=1 Tax=Plutella xylostella TaxID=51655 RepID=A0ABQ7QCG3_PLUXY|nr:hypothetical protein JYU34_012366 [Plutella xylostella]
MQLHDAAQTSVCRKNCTASCVAAAAAAAAAVAAGAPVAASLAGRTGFHDGLPGPAAAAATTAVLLRQRARVSTRNPH